MPSELEIALQSDIFSKIQVALLTLVVYDYLLTLHREIACIWSQPFRPASWLYLLNKYSLLALQASEIANLFTPSFCRGTSGLVAGFNIALLLCIALFSALRVYAIARTSAYKWLAVPIFLMELLPIGIDFFLFSRSFPTSNGILCRSSTDGDPYLASQLTFASRICLIIADSLVLFIIWLRTRGIKSDAENLQSSCKFAFTSAFLFGGAYFFVFVLVLNVSMLVVVATLGVSYVSPMVVALPSILMSHFYLDLQHAAQSMSAPKTLSEMASFDLTNLKTFSEGSPVPVLPEIRIDALPSSFLDEPAVPDVSSQV